MSKSRFQLLSSAHAMALGLLGRTAADAGDDDELDPDAAPDGDDEDKPAGDPPAGDPPAEQPPAEQPPAGDPPAPVASSKGSKLSMAQAKEAVDAARSQGASAERTRWATVMESKEGLANVANATFLLSETDSPADKIVAKLAKLGPAAAAPAKPLANTSLDLGDPTNPRAAAGGKEDADAPENIWAESDKRVHGTGAPVVPAQHANVAGAGTIQSSVPVSGY